MHATPRGASQDSQPSGDTATVAGLPAQATSTRAPAPQGFTSDARAVAAARTVCAAFTLTPLTALDASS